MDAAFFKTVGLAVLAILFIIGAAHFLKEEFDLRRNRGATISQAVVQTIWSYVVMELLVSFVWGHTDNGVGDRYCWWICRPHDHGLARSDRDHHKL